MSTPAVALFVFNRPDLTAQVVEAVRTAGPSTVLVVGDGPRIDHPADSDLIERTRAVIASTDWGCPLKTCYSDVNLGCGRRIATGLDWVFSEVESAIVLEDDCLPDPTFFPYCAELLERYRSDSRVHMITGFSAVDAGAFCESSYYFSRCYSIWGWATWGRAWRFYDYEMRAWPALRKSDWLARRIGNNAAEQMCRMFFDGTYEGTIRQWDFQWVLSGWLRDAVCVTPTRNLVTNIGHGVAGTHLRDPTHPLANLPSISLDFPLRHPPGVAVLEEADRRHWQQAVERFQRRPRAGRRRVTAGTLRQVALRFERQVGGLRRGSRSDPGLG